VSHDWRFVVKKNAVRMRCCLLAVALAVVAGPALAQSTYVQVDYMKVAPGKDQAYVDLERNVWKPYHQALVDAGRRAGWELYAVRFPAGSEVDYNYATANVFGKFTDMETPFDADVLARVRPGKDLATLASEAQAARDLVRSEAWQLLDEVPAGGPAKLSRYIRVSYMKVPAGGEDAYIALERQMWKPIHAQRVADGHAAGWALYALRFPSGAGLDYNFATVESYDQFGQLENPITLEMFKRVHPNADPATLAAMADRTTAVRELVRSELWERLDSTNPK
jgi:hypothetical protein